MCLTGIKLSKDYFKGKDNNRFYPEYIIAAPKNACELEGYVLKIRTDYVTLYERDGSIVLKHGNEWDYNSKTWRYAFEKEVKESGKRFKKYRFNEKDTCILYAKDKTPNFVEHMKRREELLSSGTGKLIRARYTIYSRTRYSVDKAEGWFVSPDSDKTWVYPLDYDPLHDLGKHNKTVKGFTILEAYEVCDIAILFESKKRLSYLLERLDHFRKIGIKDINKEYYYDSLGNFTGTSTNAASLACQLYNRIPDGITHNYKKVSKYNGEWHETPRGSALREELTALSEEMLRKCNSLIDDYKAVHIAEITEKIELLTGIHVNSS